MRKLVISLLGLGALVCASTASVAAPIGQVTGIANELDVIQKAQFIYRGRNYCWYPAGWHGAGWYWCGYAYRRGFGWGGPPGWHGWRYSRGPVVVHRGPVIVHSHRGAVVVRGPHGRRAVVRRGHRYNGYH